MPWLWSRLWSFQARPGRHSASQATALAVVVDNDPVRVHKSVRLGSLGGQAPGGLLTTTDLAEPPRRL
jgi:hypothetical protein